MRLLPSDTMTGMGWLTDFVHGLTAGDIVSLACSLILAVWNVFQGIRIAGMRKASMDSGIMMRIVFRRMHPGEPLLLNESDRPAAFVLPEGEDVRLFRDMDPIVLLEAHDSVPLRLAEGVSYDDLPEYVRIGFRTFDRSPFGRHHARLGPYRHLSAPVASRDERR